MESQDILKIFERWSGKVREFFLKICLFSNVKWYRKMFVIFVTILYKDVVERYKTSIYCLGF